MKLRQLVKNSARFWIGVDKPENLKGLRMATSWGFSINALNDKYNEKWSMTIPQEGVPAWIDSYALSHRLKNKPQHKMVAEEWLNHTLSPNFQVEVVIGQLGNFPVIRKEILQNNSLNQHSISKAELEFSEKMILWPVLSKKNRLGLRRIWRLATKNLPLNDNYIYQHK
ncbi:type 2 periplasmic-binding domain-containing protein [Piscirickettsia litoralis]|uniref:Uncharacterized protein n=1 Tax=Piscirickettsia litoralis TaxID=1891921 RepID=A0ABX3A3W2_9GAMM|nr:ABC transporter substrate-binding protein [Piscirickettsia litoralis]ODN43547.1 hypothetical protein BGC07_12250 [Piscirickettsia litoralis]